MKKIFMLFGATLALTTASFAQTETEQGNIIIDPYVGTLQSNILRSEPTSDGTRNISNWKLNGGQFGYGIRAEYMIADNFGLGIDFNYVKSGSNYDYNYSDTATNTSGTFNYDYTSVRIRTMLRMNYHFVQSDNVDAYTGFAVGHKYAKRTIDITEPGVEDFGAEQDGALIPVSVRLALGTRIYFTDNIGMMIEIGAGGGTPLQVGLSVKL
ncbi:MAG: porin family protein [bacterium]|nr:porin family protein [bacterium]